MLMLMKNIKISNALRCFTHRYQAVDTQAQFDISRYVIVLRDFAYIKHFYNEFNTIMELVDQVIKFETCDYSEITSEISDWEKNLLSEHVEYIIDYGFDPFDPSNRHLI